jgi:hypothetical protein
VLKDGTKYPPGISLGSRDDIHDYQKFAFNHVSQVIEKSNNCLENGWFFHETRGFFEISEKKAGTRGSWILIFSPNTQNWWIFDSDFFFPNNQTGRFFDSDFFK